MRVNIFPKQHILNKNSIPSSQAQQCYDNQNSIVVLKESDETQRLVEDAQRGNIEAFGKIYDLFVDRIYRFIFLRIGKKEDVEDITEEVFLKIFKNIAAYKQKTDIPFEAWLFRIVRNSVIDYYRTRKRNESIERAENVLDSKPGPEEQVLHQIEIQEVLISLRKLPKQYQEIIILKFIEDKNNEEISFILGKSIAHIRVIQSRSLKALRRVIKLDNYENDEERTCQFIKKSSGYARGQSRGRF